MGSCYHFATRLILDASGSPSLRDHTLADHRRREKWDKNSAYKAGGAKQESRRALKLQRLVFAPRGLTGLLNPLAIWHKIISVVFHGLFQLYFIPTTGLLDDSPCARKREPARDRPMPDVTGATFDYPQIAPTAA
jgi:hypothetical protein